MKETLVGQCVVCQGDILELVFYNVSEWFCTGENIQVNDCDIVYPVDFEDVPDDLHDNDPEAYGVFVEAYWDAKTMTLGLELEAC